MGRFSMKLSRDLLTACVGIVMFSSVLNAQQTAASGSSVTVPRLVNFSGKAVDAQGKTITGIAGVTFAIYAEQSGGAPVWLETQNVQADTKGNYTVQLGATKSEGLPLDLFASGTARWLGVTINGGEEQPRILLLSVPYALKAADAETVGGLPASAFVLANKQATGGSSAHASANNAAPLANPAVTGKGVAGFIPVWDSAGDIIDSVVSQKNSLVGINTTAPAARLDVNGKSDVRDTLTLFPKGTDPTLAISGTTFKVDQSGKVTFVAGQTFPHAISGVKAGTGLTGGGTGGTVTLNVDTTNVPLLAAANVFTNNQTISGGPSTWGLTVSQPNFNTILEQGPESGVGTALEMQTTGTGGMFWQILNTGESASQGANKLNFRNDSAGVDVMTLTASGQVGIGTNSPIATLDVQGNASQARTAGGMVKAMLHFSPFNGGRIVSCFNSTLSGAAATTPPCGFLFDITGVGDYIFDFGFEVDDRIYSVTPAQQQETVSACGNVDGNCNNTLTNNQVEVTVFNDTGNDFNDAKIHLIIY